MNSIVRFFKNKNTVTILGIIAVMAILFGFYYYQIQKQVKPIEVPVAAVTINPRTKITSDMITYVEVPEAYITEDVARNEDEIINMYSHFNTMIPAGSMFYKETLTTEQSMPNYILSLLKKGEYAITAKFNSEISSISAIMPNEKIDIYAKVTTENGSIMLGKIIENIEVLAVIDSEGNNVYEVNDGSRTADSLVFGVQEDIFLLLIRAQFLDIEFFPVQHGTWKDDSNAEFNLTTQELIDYIQARVVQLSTDPTLGSYKENTQIQQYQPAQ